MMKKRTIESMFLYLPVLLVLCALAFCVGARAQTISVSTTLSDTIVTGDTLQPGVPLPLIKVATKTDLSDNVLLTGAKIPTGTVYFNIEQQPGGQPIAELHYWLTSSSTATLAVLGKHTAPPFKANPISLNTVGFDRLVVNYWPQLVATSTANGTRLEVPFQIVAGGTLPTPGVSRNGNNFHITCGPKALDVVVPLPLLSIIVTGLSDVNKQNSMLCTFNPIITGGTETDCALNDTLCFPKVLVP